MFCFLVQVGKETGLFFDLLGSFFSNIWKHNVSTWQWVQTVGSFSWGWPGFLDDQEGCYMVLTHYHIPKPSKYRWIRQNRFIRHNHWSRVTTVNSCQIMRNLRHFWTPEHNWKISIKPWQDPIDLGHHPPFFDFILFPCQIPLTCAMKHRNAPWDFGKKQW